MDGRPAIPIVDFHPRRRCVRRLAALAIAFAFVLPARAEEPVPVEVRAGEHPGFARLVLDWPMPVTADLEPTSDGVTLRFPRALQADFSAARTRIAGHLNDIEVADGGRALRLGLRAGVEARLGALAADLVVVDLVRADAAANPGVGLRTGIHDDYVRVVLDWDAPVGFEVQAEGRELTVVFDRPGRIDGVELARRLEPWVEDVETGPASADGRVHLRLEPGIEASVFAVEERRVVIDLRFGAAPPAPPEVARTETTPPPAAGTTSAAATGPPAIAPSPAKPTGEPPARVAEADEERIATAAAEADATPAPPARADHPAREEAASPGPTLAITWTRPVAAAAFIRAGYLWLVFDASPDAAAELLPPAIDRSLDSIVGPGQVIGTPIGTALRFPLREPRGIDVRHDDTTWRFTMRRDPPGPAPLPRTRLEAPVRLRVEAEDGGQVVPVHDPAVGDRLLVWPLREAGRGQAQRRRLVDLELLASAQGLIVRPRAEGLEVARIEGGIALGTDAGLRLSRLPATPVGVISEEAAGEALADEEPAREEAVPASSDEIAATDRQPPADPAPAATSPSQPSAEAEPARPILGLAAWGLVDGETVTERRASLMRDLRRAGEAERGAAELDLARFFLAQAMAAETLAVLDAADGTENEPARHGLRGAAAVLDDELERAASELGNPALDRDPELALWRAVLAAAGEDWSRAAEELGRSETTFETYPPPLQLRLGLPAAMIAAGDDRTGTAISILDHLGRLDLHPAERARVDFARALIEARIGAVDDALRLLGELEAGAPAEIRVKAAFTRSRVLLDSGRISADEALARLGPARPLWRGHPWEIAMLDGLADVHLQSGDAAGAIRAWLAAIALDPPEAQRARMRLALEEAFRQALAAGAGGAIGAIRALALYRDFPELVPDGVEGVRLRRRLATRLAALDLVQPAAELLEVVLDGDLAAATRAATGLQLAELHLRGPDPEAALAALDATAGGDDVAADLRVGRELVRARALAALGRIEEALALVAGRDDAAALQVRLAVHWQAEDWSAVADAAEALLARRAEADAPLSEAEQMLVLRLAVANVQLDRTRALERLRRRFGPAMRSTGAEPAFLMATRVNGEADGPKAALAAVDRQLDELGVYLGRP